MGKFLAFLNVSRGMLHTGCQGHSTTIWTLFKGILSGPLPKTTAIHSAIFVGPAHMRALYT